MKTSEAIASLKTLCNTCTMFPKCVNNKPECFQAIEKAISALEKQEKDRWIPVIRCEDCKYYGSRRWCELHSSVFNDNAFCSYGERREESDNG